MRKILLALLGLFLMGCAPTARLYEPMSLNTTSQDTGFKFECVRFLGQTEVVGHIIKVDDQEFPVDAMATLRVFVNPGYHTVRISSTAEKIKKQDDFGEEQKISTRSYYVYGNPVEFKIYLKGGDFKTVDYKSPFWSNMAGHMEIK
ncbi:MAG: hypothetical protein HQL26_02930 [Candidatus Omnitrophica bacterium]|nr:hypothetical protein [Candidatus Omnitrophota bacterium]